MPLPSPLYPLNGPEIPLGPWLREGREGGEERERGDEEVSRRGGRRRDEEGRGVEEGRGERREFKSSM